MSEVRAVVMLNGVDLHCRLGAAGDRLRLRCGAEDWPGYRPGTRVVLHRTRAGGPEWYTVDGVLPVGEERLVVLMPAAPPPAEKPYSPPMGRCSW